MPVIVLPTYKQNDPAIKLTGTAQAGTGNKFYYEVISNTSVPISSGDILVLDCYGIGSPVQFSIDGSVPGATSGNLRDTPGIADQNGLVIHPATDLTSVALNKWYHREFVLNSVAGLSVTQWWIAFESDLAGSYIGYIKNIYVLTSTRATKATIFNGTLDVPAITPSIVSQYVSITKTVVREV